MWTGSKICANWKGIIFDVIKGAESKLQAGEIQSYLVPKMDLQPEEVISVHR